VSSYVIRILIIQTTVQKLLIRCSNLNGFLKSQISHGAKYSLSRNCILDELDIDIYNDVSRQALYEAASK
jgi:hypothetical protein